MNVAAHIGASVSHAFSAVGRFTVENPVARKTAMLAVSYFIGPCALACTAGYIALSALDTPDVMDKMGVKDPRVKFLAKVGVTILVGAACLELISASATVAKIIALTAFTFYAAPEITAMMTGS